MASAVGLICVEIFGYRDPAARDYAVNLGMALQLTNIIRDVAVDLKRGRIYLPLEDLHWFSVTEHELRAGVVTPRRPPLLRYQCRRARYYYRLAAEQLPRTIAGSLVAAEIMGGIYFEILRRIERAQLRRVQQRDPGAALAARDDGAAVVGGEPVPAVAATAGAGSPHASPAGRSRRRRRCGHHRRRLCRPERGDGAGRARRTRARARGRPALGGRASSFTEPAAARRVDNGQHILIGCYDETFAFLRRVGVASKVTIRSGLSADSVDAAGRWSRLSCPALPSPLHLLAGLWRWPALSLRDRLAVLRLALRKTPLPSETVRRG